ncbi:hypothetical protein L916_03267, partial [Phytophthora nicotianae]
MTRLLFTAFLVTVVIGIVSAQSGSAPAETSLIETANPTINSDLISTDNGAIAGSASTTPSSSDDSTPPPSDPNTVDSPEIPVTTPTDESTPSSDPESTATDESTPSSDPESTATDESTPSSDPESTATDESTPSSDP